MNNPYSAYYMQSEQKQPHNPYQDPRYAKYEKYGDQQELEAEIERDAKLLFKKKQLEKIEGFTGYFEFMRLDFPAPVYYEGDIYSTAAHAYNAAKAEEPIIRKRIQKAPTLQEMYNVARTIQEPEGWTHKKMKIMEKILRDKFRRSRDLRERLAATQNREIVNIVSEKNEDNLFWGIVNKLGQNHLGKLLEKVRQSIHDETEVEHWMNITFNLIEERKKIPTINLEVFKDGQLIESITLENKSYYVFGAHPEKCNVLLRHQSISRVHAAFLIDRDLGVVLVDLMSKAGTKLDDKTIEGCVPAQVKQGQKVVFGLSTRVYEVKIDYSKMQKAVEIEKRALEREMRLLSKLDDPNVDVDTLKSTLGLIKEDTIYVSNLPYSCNEQELQQLFGDCGKILSIRMPENRQTKQSRGFAFITFENEKAFRKAMNYDGHKFYGRKLKVTKAEKKQEIEDIRNDRQREDLKGNEEELKRDLERRHGKRRYDDENYERRDRRRSRSRDRYHRDRDRDNRDNKRRDDDRNNKKHNNRKRSYSSSSSSSSSSNSSSQSSSSQESKQSQHKDIADTTNNQQLNQ